MRVAEQRDAIGRELQNLLNGMSKSFGRLIGQSVDEVDIDAVKAQFACAEKQVACQLERLKPMNGFLDFGMKILNAHAEPVESEAAQSFEVVSRSDARIHFDADFRVGSEMEMLARGAE